MDRPTPTRGTGGVVDSTDDFFPGTGGNNAALPEPAHGGQFYAASSTTGTRSVVTLTSAPFGTIAPNTVYTVTIAFGDALTGVLASYATTRHAATTITLSSIDGGGSATLATGTYGSNQYPATPSGTFTDYSFTYTSGDATDPNVGRQFSLSLRASPTRGSELHVDNIRMDDGAVPEPGSAMLAAIGFGLLCQRRRAR